MRILVTLLVMVTVAAASGCARERQGAAPRESRLANLPFVYRMTVQQGNIVAEEMVDGLELGMNRAQVQYVLGSPMLADLFHTDRWDYTYTIRRGHQPMEVKPLTLWFEDDQLVRIDGRQPNPERALQAQERREIVIDVPDWQDRSNLLGRALNAVGAKP